MKDKNHLTLAEALAKDNALVGEEAIEGAILSLRKELEQLDAVASRKHQKIFTILKSLGTNNIKLLVKYCGCDPSFYKKKSELVLAVMRGQTVEFVD